MKTCETCGKVLDNSMQEFRINGILQCESCAYPDHKPIINNFNEKEYDKLFSETETTPKNFWAKVLKIIGGCNVVIGIISSIAIGFAVEELIDGDISILLLAVIIIVGIVFSIISSALLMAFATLAEDISVIRQINKKLKLISFDIKNNRLNVKNENTNTNSSKKVVDRTIEEKHKCQKCGHVQRKEINRCLKCGEFIEDL